MKLIPWMMHVFLAAGAVGPAVAAPALVQDHAAFRLWLSYPAEKILKNSKLPVKLRSDKVVLSAARNEFEPFLLVLRPKGRRPLFDVRFECNPIASSEGRAGQPLTIQVHRLSYVNVDRPSGVSIFPEIGMRFADSAIPFGSSGTTGYFPERLVPERISVAEPGVNTSFWFTLAIPRGAASGSHKGKLVLRVRGAEAIDVPLEVQVFDFALPAASSLRNTTSWSPQYVIKTWDKAKLKAFYREMSAYRQAIEPILPQPELRVGKDGTVEIDTKEYDEMLAYCLDELGMTHFFFPRVGGAWYTNLYFLWHTPMLLKERWYGVPIFEDDLSLTNQFKQVFGQYLKKMAAHFRERGWLNKAYITSMDEPQKPEDWKAVAAYGRFVHAVVPELKVFCTTWPRPELHGAIDAWCPQQYDRDAVLSRQAKGEAFMFYKNWITLIDMPMVNPRVLGWIAWKTKAAGWLTYATMGKWNTAWDEPYVIYPNIGNLAWGLGLMWYPELFRPGILKSVRWEMMREGAEDYEYLALLERRLAALPAGPKTRPEARQARAFLDSACEKVILYPRVLPDGREEQWKKKANYTTSHQLVWELRNRAADLIQALPAVPLAP